MHFSALAQAADKYKFCWVCFFVLFFALVLILACLSVRPSTHPLNLSFSHWTLICYSCLWINNILYIWTQLWVSLHINSANTNTHIKTCHLQKSKTFWHLSFFFNGFWLFFFLFLFSKIGTYTTGLVLLVVESHWQSPCSVFTILGCLYSASENVGIAPTIKQMFCLLLPPSLNAGWDRHLKWVQQTCWWTAQ